MKFEVKKVEELNEVAKQLVKAFKHKVVCFEGEMGAGKTTLIKEIVKELGSDDEANSPSFSIVNEYETKDGQIYHFDFYRLKKEEEALDIGLEDYLYSNKYCLIEWPNKIANFVPSEHHLVQIKVKNSMREIIFI